MGILGDMVRAVGEVRRVGKALSDVTRDKSQRVELQKALAAEQKRRQALEAAIRRHREEGQQIPRRWEHDEALWRLLDEPVSAR